jgi:hypothetical protein
MSQVEKIFCHHDLIVAAKNEKNLSGPQRPKLPPWQPKFRPEAK